MNKKLQKAIMERTRLRNKFLKYKTVSNKISYNKQRNYCVNLCRKEKKLSYNNLDINKVIDNKQFWKTIKPAFSEKSNKSDKITLIEMLRSYQRIHKLQKHLTITFLISLVT